MTDAENGNGKQIYISFEDAQAALPDKEFYEADHSSNSGGSRSAPDWEDTPGAYEFTASLTTVVLDDGTALGDEGDILGAFDADGNVRGVGTMQAGIGPSAGTTMHAITVRSNAAGDEISFQYYDASEDAVLGISTSYTFVINDIQGSLLTGGYDLNIGAPDLSCPECSDAGGLPWDCATAVGMFGCDFSWPPGIIADFCQATCGNCPEEDACGVCEGDGSSCTDCAGNVDGDAEEDCFGACEGDGFTDCAGSCLPGSLISWLGDGYCDDGAFGVDFVSFLNVFEDFGPS